MHKRRNWLTGIIAVIVAGLLLLRALAVVPDGLYDILYRAWPALLVLFGLAVLLRNRLPLASLAAVLISAGLVFAVATTAFSTRATQQRDDYRLPITQTINEEVTLLRVSVDSLTTDIDIVQTNADPREISGQFLGSTESFIDTEYEEDGAGGATFRLQEIRSNPFPLLETIGRGALRLELPPNLAVDVVVNGEEGSATLNMANLNLERLNLNWQQGSALVTLPEYQPLSPNIINEPGTLSVPNGNITLAIPLNIGSRLELNRSGSGIEPQADESIYNYLRDDVLESRNYDNADIVMRYIINSRGLIRVENLP